MNVTLQGEGMMAFDNRRAKRKSKEDKMRAICVGPGDIIGFADKMRHEFTHQVIRLERTHCEPAAPAGEDPFKGDLTALRNLRVVVTFRFGDVDEYWLGKEREVHDFGTAADDDKSMETDELEVDVSVDEGEEFVPENAEELDDKGAPTDKSAPRRTRSTSIPQATPPSKAAKTPARQTTRNPE